MTLINEYNLHRVISIEIYENLKVVYQKQKEVRNKIESTQYDYIIDCGEYVLYKKGCEPLQIGLFVSIFTLDNYCINNNIYK